jgi:uncharacterized protein (DUF58 family)
MALTIKEILKKVRKIELKTKGLSSMEFSGSYKTTFKGRGMSFSEVRPYQYGDDIRNIDWNVTARTGDPHIKVFEEEREQTFMLLIDVSGSSFFGANVQTKNEFIAEVAATLAFSAISNNDKVGVIFFTDRIEKYLPPKKGHNHILRIIRDLLFIEPKSQGTDIAQAMKYLNNLVKRRCTTFLISDFMNQGYEAALKVAASRHDMVGVHIYDIRETELPNVGLLPVVDAEGGKMQWVDTGSATVRENYKKRFQDNLKYFNHTFSRMGADTLSIATHESYANTLRRFFKERTKFA